MVDVSDEWRWVDAEGAQNKTDKWELVSLLSMQEIPYFTLVWQPGWAEWLPACRVDELAQAVGESAEPAVKPRRDRSAKVPPSPPLYKYRAYQAREGQPWQSPKKALQQSSPPKASSSRPPVSLSPDIDELGRRPMPTLADVPAPIHGGSTLRPPAAVPPPPRAMPQGPGTAKAASAREAILEELVPGSTTTALVDPSPPSAGREVVDATSGGGKPGPAADRPESIRRATALPLASNAVLVASGLIVVIALVLGGMAIAVLATKQKAAPSTPSSVAPPLASASVASSGAAKPAPPKPCLLARSARRIYGAADRSIPPVLLSLPNDRVAVGLAANPTTAVGLTIESETLSIKQEMLETDEPSLIGVVPLYAKELHFAVDREVADVRQIHTISAELAVGMTDDGFVRRRGAAIDVVWPGGGDQPTTAPRTATVPGRGHVVTFRRGGQGGAVLAGWLKPDGSRASPLQEIAGEGYSGTPSVAVGSKDALITFASRPDSDAKWGVALAAAPVGDLPRRSLPFVIPPGGPGVETIAPSATGLDDGRWLLQWTEGATGNRQVRVQTLAPDLSPIGDAITLSAVEDNAGQGVVHAIGAKVLSLFLVIRGGAPQLWAAALKCD